MSQTITRERGRITIQPPRVTCGECPAVMDVEPDDLNVAREAQRARWGYTMTSGWVCPSCKPKRRLLDDENVAREAQRARWGYTMTSGWVCPSCKPKRRLLDDEPMRGAT